MSHGLLECAVAQGADVGARGEHLVGPGDDDAANLGVGVVALGRGRDRLHHLRGEGVARVRPVHPQQRDPTLEARVDQTRRDIAYDFPPLDSKGRNALIPVASRPMISFWICDVPS